MIKDIEPLLKECKETLEELLRLGETKTACYVQGFINSINKLPEAERPHGEWIPIMLRPMTEEEVKEQEEKWGWTLDDKDKFVFNCPLPDEGQEILISTRCGVRIDTCDYDPDYGYGLEENGDWDGVIAWMPLPEPYKEGDSDAQH